MASSDTGLRQGCRWCGSCLVYVFSWRGESLPRTHRPGVCAKLLSQVQLFATLWTIACQAPVSMAFSRQEYWSGLS